MKKQIRSAYRLWLSWAFVAIPALWGILQTLFKAMALFCICLVIVVSCTKVGEPENSPKSINAIALSRNSSVLVDRTIYWWHQEDINGSSAAKADTIRLTANVFYGATVGFYHIENGDTTNLSNEVTAPANAYLVLWTASDSAALGIDFKGQDPKGLEVFLYPSDQSGVHTLTLKLLHHAGPSNPVNPGGDSIVACRFPLIIE
jgi:hypothetical protein